MFWHTHSTLPGSLDSVHIMAPMSEIIKEYDEAEDETEKGIATETEEDLHASPAMHLPGAITLIVPCFLLYSALSPRIAFSLLVQPPSLVISFLITAPLLFAYVPPVIESVTGASITASGSTSTTSFGEIESEVIDSTPVTASSPAIYSFGGTIRCDKTSRTYTSLIPVFE